MAGHRRTPMYWEMGSGKHLLRRSSSGRSALQCILSNDDVGLILFYPPTDTECGLIAAALTRHATPHVGGAHGPVVSQGTEESAGRSPLPSSTMSA